MARIDDQQSENHESAALVAIDWRQGPELPASYPKTLTDLIAHCVQVHGEHIILRDGGLTATWPQLDRWSARLAACWQERLQPGDRCAIVLPNSLAHLIVELACWRLGAIAAPIFGGFPAPRLGALLHDLNPSLLVTDDRMLRTAVPSETTYYNSAAILALANSTGPSAERAVNATDPCLIQFTSGSTNLPRGVVLTHGNLTSQQVAFAAHWPEVGHDDRLACYLPWHHSFGGLAERLWALCRGATITIIPGGGRDRVLFAETLKVVRPTIFMSVPKLHAVVAEENLLDLSCLRFVFTAGAPLPACLYDWYAQHQVPVCEGWGLTETSPCCTLTKPGLGCPGSVGWPIAGVAVGIRASDQHIVVRGPNVMAGYYQRETPNLQQGILDTGDLGEWSQDGLLLRGRADHQLKLSNGEKVGAAELEAALLAQPGIRHVVIGAEPELTAIIECEYINDHEKARSAVDVVNGIATVPYHHITTVVVINRPMGIDNDLLTPSHKVARSQVLDRYRRWRCDGGDHFTTIK